VLIKCILCEEYMKSGTSHSLSIRSILMLSSSLRLCLPISLLPSGFFTKIVYAYYILKPSYHPLIEHFNVWRSVQVMKILFMQSLPASSSLLGRNVILTTLLSNTFNLCSSHIVRYQVTHSHKTTSKVMVL
jgi:hypothetical protein